MTTFEENLRCFSSRLSDRHLKGINLEKLRGQKPDSIIVCGMGGSGIAGDILRDLAPFLGVPLPIVMVKSGNVPPFPYRKPLFICVSCSGETEETAACLQSALHGNHAIAVVTGEHGGTLKAIAEEKNLPLVTFPNKNLTPREASGTMLYSLAKILRVIFPRLTIHDFSHSSIGDNLAPRASAMAKEMHGKNILIYSDEPHRALGSFWKININETAKQVAFANTYPEIFHNEIVGFENKDQRKTNWITLWIIPQLTTTTSTGERKIIQKTKFAVQVFKQMGVASISICLNGRSEEEKFWRNAALASWTSFYLAKRNKVSPSETEVIQKLKERSGR